MNSEDKLDGIDDLISLITALKQLNDIRIF